jgi:cell division protein FtsZ
MVQALEPVQVNHTRAPLTARRPQPTGESQPIVQPPQIENQVEQAVAEAITREPPVPQHYQDDGITVEPYVPAAFHTSIEDMVPQAETPMPSVYVPSDAERPDGQRRMPRTEELPAVARRSLSAQEKHEPEPRNARALFKRLASNVGLSLRPAEPTAHDESGNSSADDAAARSAIEAGASRVSRGSPGAEGAPGNLDAHGRQMQQPAAKEHIEIPAFLRKHG